MRCIEFGRGQRTREAARATGHEVGESVEDHEGWPSRPGHVRRQCTRLNIGYESREVRRGQESHSALLEYPINKLLCKAALAKDVKAELEAALGVLSGRGKGAKGKTPRGLERKKMWEEVRALRKEYVVASIPKTLPDITTTKGTVSEKEGWLRAS